MQLAAARPLLTAATRVGGRRIASPLAHSARRSYAAVTDAAANPVKRHGGLRDQDRIFSNAYRMHDWQLKGAQVRPPLSSSSPSSPPPRRPQPHPTIDHLCQPCTLVRAHGEPLRRPAPLAKTI